VFDGVIDQLMLFTPLAGPPMEFNQALWLLLPQLLKQQIAKEMVIAVPTVFTVQWHHKQVGLLKLLEHALSAGLQSHCVA